MAETLAERVEKHKYALLLTALVLVQIIPGPFPITERRRIGAAFRHCAARRRPRGRAATDG